jgi:hypothetical protein
MSTFQLGVVVRLGLGLRLRSFVLAAATTGAVLAAPSPAHADDAKWLAYQGDCNGIDVGVSPRPRPQPFAPYFFSEHRVFIPYRVQYHFFGDAGNIKTRHGITNGDLVARRGPVPENLMLCDFVGAVTQNGQLSEFTVNVWGVIR